MKYLLFLFPLSTLILISSCIDEGIRPSGEATTVTFEYDDFQTINVSDAFNVELVYDTIDPHVTVTIDYNLLPYMEVIQHDGDLIFALQRGIYAQGNAIQSATVYTSNILTDINGSGASNITIADPLIGDDLDVDLSGASRIDAELYLSSLSVNLSDASTADFSGAANLYFIECSGASSARGYGLFTDQLVAELSGASTGMFSVAESIIAEASGASTIRYRGDADVLRADLSGGSHLEKVD